MNMDSYGGRRGKFSRPPKSAAWRLRGNDPGDDAAPDPGFPEDPEEEKVNVSQGQPGSEFADPELEELLIQRSRPAERRAEDFLSQWLKRVGRR